jgi:hypothetical protein
MTDDGVSVMDGSELRPIAKLKSFLSPLFRDVRRCPRTDSHLTYMIDIALTSAAAGPGLAAAVG